MTTPIVLGQPRETREWYVGAAKKAILIATALRERLVVKLTKHGSVVVDVDGQIDDVKFHVLTITDETDHRFLASELEEHAIDLGFDSGVRKGRKVQCQA